MRWLEDLMLLSSTMYHFDVLYAAIIAQIFFSMIPFDVNRKWYMQCNIGIVLVHQYIALSYNKGGTFWRCRPISSFMQPEPLCHYFNRLPARKWGLVQKDLESTLTMRRFNIFNIYYIPPKLKSGELYFVSFGDRFQNQMLSPCKEMVKNLNQILLFFV